MTHILKIIVPTGLRWNTENKWNHIRKNTGWKAFNKVWQKTYTVKHNHKIMRREVSSYQENPCATDAFLYMRIGRYRSNRNRFVNWQDDMDWKGFLYSHYDEEDNWFNNLILITLINIAWIIVVRHEWKGCIPRPWLVITHHIMVHNQASIGTEYWWYLSWWIYTGQRLYLNDWFYRVSEALKINSKQRSNNTN